MQVEKYQVKPPFGFFQLFECQVRDQAPTEAKEGVHWYQPVQDDVERRMLGIHLHEAKDVLGVACGKVDQQSVAEHNPRDWHEPDPVQTGQPLFASLTFVDPHQRAHVSVHSEPEHKLLPVCQELVARLFSFLLCQVLLGLVNISFKSWKL